MRIASESKRVDVVVAIFAREDGALLFTSRPQGKPFLDIGSFRVVRLR